MANLVFNVYMSDKEHSCPNAIHVYVERNMTIHNLKDIIHRQMEIPHETQNWIITGQLWDDQTMLKDCRIPINVDMIHVCLFLAPVKELEFKHMVTALDQPFFKIDNKVVAWSCPTCTVLNEPTRPGCEMCSTDRPANYKIPVDYVATPAAKRVLLHEKTARQRFDAERNQIKEMGLNIIAKEDEVPYFHTSEEFDCPICFGEIAKGEGVILRGCAHQLCLPCLRNYIGEIDTAVVGCPYEECDSQLEDREVRGVGGEDFYARYVGLCNRQAAASQENSVHCKTPDCKGWAVYENKNGVFKCQICKKDNCLTCGAIHDNLSCEKYQEDLRVNAVNDATKKADLEHLQTLVRNGDAMHCPGCRIIIQKARGCDFVQCRNCAMQICWATKQARWGPNGPGDTSGGCKCRVNGVKCHPNCKNCH